MINFQISLVRDVLGVRLCFSDQRREALAQISCGHLVEAVIDLAGIDQAFALAAADIDSVPLLAVERKSGNRQRSRCWQVTLTQLLP